MKKLNVFLFFLLAVFVLDGQNVMVRGFAHEMHKGKPVIVYGYDDLVTYTRVKLASDTVNNEGVFQLAFNLETATKVEVCIDNLRGNMYAVPKNYYVITFPGPDSSYDISPNVEYPVDLGFVYKEKNDTTEMNSLIINFNREFRRFFVMNYQEIMAKKRFYDKLDSFQVASYKKYEYVKEPYFRSWLEYTFASENENLLRNRGLLANLYIINKPVLYNNYEYMRFINVFFSQYLKMKASTKKGTDIIDIINENGDPHMLNETLKKDPVLQNDSLRELVMIKGLYEMYFSPEYKRDKVLPMIEQIGRETKNAWHRKIIKNMILQFYRLSPGSDAPAFTLLNKKGEAVSLSDFRGKYVYLDFMATWCGPCLQEMREIADMKKKYGDKVVFISISVDEKEEDLKKFLQKNPKYDWTFLWYGADKSVKTRYNIKALPTYFFINQEGKLVLSPAPTPAEGFEGVLQDMFKPKKKKGPMEK